MGDQRTAAVISADGTVEWFCPGRFDAPASFFRLVHADGGGLRTGAAGSPPTPGVQRYAPGPSPVLHTRLLHADATLELSDHLRASRLVRVVTCLAGEVDVAWAVQPGHQFGRPRRTERWSEGVAFGDLAVRGWPEEESRRLCAGERVVITVGDRRGAHLAIDGALDSQRRVQDEWASALAEIPYDGPYRDPVLAAAMQIRMCTYEPSGAVVDAVTTSLPVRTGNERNVDQRLAWVRTNAAVVLLWRRLRMADWALATERWLADIAARDLPHAPVWGVEGEGVPAETELPLGGWRECAPVRIGNRAAEGIDLSAIALTALTLRPAQHWPLIERLGDWLADPGNWGHEEHGPDDLRGKPQQLVVGKLAAAVALRDLAARRRGRNPLDLGALMWSDSADVIGEWLRMNATFGVLPRSGWGRALGDNSSSAAVLRWAAPADPSQPLPLLPGDGEAEGGLRLMATLDQTIAQLSEGPFVHRHLAHVDDGFPPGSAPDLAASFLVVTALARAGRYDDAHERMESLVGFLHPLGLTPTHADPFTGDYRGNLCSAATSLALIEAALALATGPR